MLVARRRGRTGTHLQDIWPGFVDALSTLLMVIIFVLMIVFVAQFSLSHVLKNKESDLANLSQELQVMSNQLDITSKDLEKTAAEKQANAELVQRLEKVLEDLKINLSTVQNDLGITAAEKEAVLEEQETLKQKEGELATQVEHLNEQLQQLTSMLKISELEAHKNQNIIVDLKGKLHQALLQMAEQNKKLYQESLHSYRSEFFTKLKQIIGDRDDIRVVDDRFVFQSEVFFDLGSSELSTEGCTQLDRLATILTDMASKIPPNITWILRVDGHTDNKPIRSKFTSNWELSTARAISVVKHLIDKGIPPHRLVAAGFGEHQPLVKEGSDQDIARNRRIEFKLDQR